MNSIPAKDVIYIDVDDEITTIIDKVRESKSKIIALVLPKRATTLQSVVNMKLLKKSADSDSKHLVLITAEAGLMPLAASIGLYVAKTLQSKPEVPDMPAGAHTAPLEDSEEAISMEDALAPALNKHTSVGDLASGAAASSAAAGLRDVDDAIELDDLDDADMPAAGAAFAGASTDKKGNKAKLGGKKNSKFKVPNFNKFRVLLIAGGAGLVALIILLYVCVTVLPKATILVKTDSTAVNSNMNVTLNTDATTASADTNTVPATSQQIQKTLTQQVASTGQQNNGTKAGGTLTMSAGACSGTVPADVPAGTGVTSSSLTFITQADAAFSPVISKGKCTFQTASSIAITAQAAGAQYNIPAGSFSVAGRSDVSATSGSATTGGTDNIVKIVQQSDIDNAKQKLGSIDTSSIKQQLQTQLTNAGVMPIAATFSSGTPNYTNSANNGDTADNVTVTETATYTMLGAKQNDLEQLIKSSVGGKIDTSKQNISDFGLSKASFSQGTPNGTHPVVAMQVTSVVGPILSVDQLKKAVAGKKSSDAESIIKQNPGVTDVTVSYSPFWVSAIPGNTSKITLTIDKPQTTVNAKS